MIETIVQWNKIAGNNHFNYHLESSMLVEELAETIIAIKNNNKVEALDGVIDTFIIGVGTLHKMGIPAGTISRAFDMIMENNYSKFKKMDSGTYMCEKNGDGKIVKPKDFVPVDLNVLFK